MPPIANPAARSPNEPLPDLGGISPDRVVWLGRPATEEDPLKLVNGEPKRLVEWIDGYLVEKPMGNREALFASSFSAILCGFVRPRRLGVVAAPDAIVRMQNGRNRLPDIYFTPWSALPTDHTHLQPVAHYPIELAVEILSDGDTPAEMLQKRREYFASGTRLVWIVDPDARTVAVFTDPDTHTVLSAADTLSGDPVLPGFALPLTDLFDDPQLNPRPPRTA